VTQLAQVTQLSPATKAVVSYHGSGRVDSLTLIRGRQAFVLDGREAERLKVALETRVAVEAE
jgi:hypothetical protein